MPFYPWLLICLIFNAKSLSLLNEEDGRLLLDNAAQTFPQPR